MKFKHMRLFMIFAIKGVYSAKLPPQYLLRLYQNHLMG